MKEVMTYDYGHNWDKADRGLETKAARQVYFCSLKK
jgi:hypothetical protein